MGAALLAGCSGQGTQPSTRSQSADQWKEGLDGDIVDALSQLSDEDRMAALKQNTCPVADNLLGSMGKPPKVTVKGQDVFLCCAGCEEELKSNPEKYLAKLNENK